MQKHVELKSNKTTECDDCKETFKRISTMMLHRKTKHPDKVRLCRSPESCEYTNCWYMHRKTNNGNNEIVSNSINQNEKEQDFHIGQVKLNPPLVKRNQPEMLP